MPKEQEMQELFVGLKQGKIEQYGSGWGYVSNCLRERKQTLSISARVTFPKDAVRQEEQIWLDFLETGIMKEYCPEHPPISFHTDPYFLKLFEEQISRGEANAYMYLQYGIVLYANEKVEEAYQAFVSSNQCKPNAWAYRNLSMLEKHQGRRSFLISYLGKAI